MSILFQVILVLIIVGIVLWGLKAFPAIDETLKQMIRVLVIVVTAIYVVTLLWPFVTHIAL